MRKLTLDPDALQVQSFVIHHAGAFPFGTVHGRQKQDTGPHDVRCSALVPCHSALGCSEGNTCRAECTRDCPSGQDACPSAPDCTPVGACPPEPSAIDVCPAERTQGDDCRESAGCEPPACPGPMSLVSCAH